MMNGSKAYGPSGEDRASGPMRAGRVLRAFPSPLTPTLSLRERGNRSQCFGRSNRAGFADSLAAILPLPKGEGRAFAAPEWLRPRRRGEGEQDAA